MSDFDPQPADTSGRDFQESLFGREELAAPPLGFFGGIMPRDDLGKNPVSDAISQQLLYGSAMVAHMFSSPESTAPGHVSRSWESDLRDAAKSLDPEPGTQGVGTQAVAGLASFATQVAMGGGPVGGILSVGALSAYEGYHNARDQGLDETTSEHMGLAEGGSGALFAGLPFGALARNSGLGVRLLTSLVEGVGANTGIGMTTRYGQHKILADAGYPELAEQYKAFDRDSIMMDAATGLFPAAHLAGTEGLGVAADAMIRKATEIAINNGRVRDAVSTTTDARAQRERAPGIPIDPQSAAAHTSAEHTALIQTLNRQGIDLSNTPIEEGATFLQPARDPAAMDEARGVFMDVLKEHLGEEVTLDPEARRVAEVLGVPVPEEAPAAAPVVAPADEVRPPELPEVDPFASEPAKKPAALPPKNMKTSDAREDSILEYLAKHKRGISMDEARKQGLDPAEMKGPAAKVGIKSAFRRGGMTFDEAAAHLAEEGYPVKDSAGNYDPNLVLSAIDQELRGTPVHSIVNERIALEDEAMLRDRAEIDIKIPDEKTTAPEVKDMAALEAHARALDNDRTTEIMESWEKDDPETIARVRKELEEIIYGSEEGGRTEGSQQDKGSGGPKLGAGEGDSTEATTESIPTPAERSRPTADTGPGAGFSNTGSDAGDRFAGRDTALAREAISDRDKVRAGLAALLDRAGRESAMEAQGQDILDSMEEAGETPKQVSDKFWSDTYWKLAAEAQRRFEKYAKSLGFEPGDTIRAYNDGRPPDVAKDWQEVGEFIGHDFPNRADHLEGTERGYVAMMKWANDAADRIHEAPEAKPLTIVDENGQAHPAADALENVKALEDQANLEAAKAFDAAADCARRQA